MCGRFYVDEGTAKEIEQVIRGVDLRIQKMYTGDIYPSQSAGILTCHSQQKNPLSAGSAAENSPALELNEMHWGFPQYQKKGLLINARAETALERRTFRESVLHRRCVIPARQFYEWDLDKNKVTFSERTERFYLWQDSITGFRMRCVSLFLRRRRMLL